ncbi:MAG TPA: RluA family pseudouridine synthase [Pirellulaceae bacterium]|nr:RluA family pseudouridine synthase [Pirellulaceae bacterium]
MSDSLGGLPFWQGRLAAPYRSPRPRRHNPFMLTKTLVLAADHPPTLFRMDRAVQSLTGVSRRQLQGLFDHGCVSLNGQTSSAPWLHLKEGDRVDVTYDPDQRYAANKRPPKHLGFDILLDDEWVIVVNKPAQWLTVPTPKGERNTLIQRVSEYLTKKNRGRHVHVTAVHRLDRGVSGAIVFAKDSTVATALRQEFSEHKPLRLYLAIVAGVVTRDSGEFRSHLGVGPGLRQRSVDDEAEGQLAVTHYRVLRRLGDATLVEVRLETGRRNQIRVHFSEAGFPVLGDTLYAPQSSSHPRWPHPRLALHSRRLVFQHPGREPGVICDFEIPAPAEFTEFLGADAAALPEVEGTTGEGSTG